MKIAIIGRGKVGTAMFRALGNQVPASSFEARGRFGRIDADLVIIAVRDDALPALVERLRHVDLRGAAVVHVAGALGPDVLAPLRKGSLGVAQAHPVLSFASKRHPPSFDGASLFLRGDARAVARARRFAKLVGLVPREFPNVDASLYHAALALASNGMAALAWSGGELLVRAGVPERSVSEVLAPLLRSVAENVARLGARAALTGPIRRGDHATVAKHVAAVRHAAPEVERIYVASAEIQVEMAAQLGELDRAARIGLQRALHGSNFRPARPQKSAPAARPKKAQTRQKKS